MPYMESLKGPIKNLKLVLIAVMVLIVLLIVLMTANFREAKTFDIEDKCGRIVNLEQHTVPDEAACRSRCRAQCESIDYKFDKVEFQENVVGCHSCKCYCK